MHLTHSFTKLKFLIHFSSIVSFTLYQFLLSSLFCFFFFLGRILEIKNLPCLGLALINVFILFIVISNIIYYGLN